MSKKEKGKAESEWSQLKTAYLLELSLYENMFMHGEPSIMDSCYSKLRALIHFLTGGQSLKILSDGTWKRDTIVARRR